MDVAAETARMRCVVEGRVQGVGYRYFVVRTAESLGLAGWVRNREDRRSVATVAEGPRPALERLRDALRNGPPGAVVDRVTCEWLEAGPEFQDFTIRR